MNRAQLKQAKLSALSGNLKLSETRKVAEIIKNDINLYICIEIIGMSGFSEFFPILEKFSLYESDADVACLALSFLLDTTQHDQYKQILIYYLKGAPWDWRSSYKLNAISISSQYLRKNLDKEILSCVFKIFDNNGDELLKEQSQKTILRAGGMEWRNIVDSSFNLYPMSKKMKFTISKMRKVILT